MKTILLALALIPSLALANVQRDIVTTAKISPSSPARYVFWQSWCTAAANGTTCHASYPYPGGARVVDLIVYQHAAGAGGTSFTVDVKNGATSLLSTLPVVTFASGADKVTDARGNLALPAGWTRPVLKTDSTITVAQGTKLSIATVETGTYSPHPSFLVTLVFEPLQ